MKLVMFPLLCGTLSVAIAQTGTLSGSVRSWDGKPQPGCRVNLENLDRSALTAADGRFSLPQLPTALRRADVVPRNPAASPRFLGRDLRGALRGPDHDVTKEAWPGVLPKTGTPTALDTLAILCPGQLARRIGVERYAQDLGTLMVRPTNIILIHLDDAGYGDFGIYGQKGYATPAIDRLARESIRFNQYYSTQAACSASRAGLMTGTYPNRFSFPYVLSPNSAAGLHANEVTLAELMKQNGYATAAFGKWHLGDRLEALPLRHGFDEFLGIPYSADMWPANGYPALPLFEGETVVDAAIDSNDQKTLTRRFTDGTIAFLRKHKEKPFFIYLAYNQPHVPLFVSDAFKGKSGAGLYGDVIGEIDFSVGRILDTLAGEGLDRSTLVILASDNGPWRLYGNHAGSTGPFREEKGTTFEGGMHVACLVRAPGQVSGGRLTEEPVMGIDFLPTLAAWIGAAVPGHKLDGRDLGPLWRGESQVPSPYYLFNGSALQAVRSGRWKLHLPHAYRQVATAGQNGTRGTYKSPEPTTPLALYDLEADPGEANNLAATYPALADSLRNLGNAFQADLNAHMRPLGSY